MPGNIARSIALDGRCARLAALLMLLGIVGIGASGVRAEAWQNARVVLTTGWEYVNVSVERISGESAVYLVNEEGARKKLSFSIIRFVFDAQGKDITALVISGSVQPSGESALRDTATFEPSSADTAGAMVPAPAAVPEPEFEREPISLRETEEDPDYNRRSYLRKPFRCIIVAGAGYGTSVGDWFEGMTSGLMTGGIIRIRTSDKSYIGFRVNNQWLDVKESLKRVCEYGEYNCYNLDWDIRLDEYYLIWGNTTGGAMKRRAFLYVEGGIGAIRHKIAVNVSNEYEAAYGEGSQTKMAAMLSVGACIPFHRNIGLHLEGNVRVTGEDYIPLITYTAQNVGGIFGCKAGIAIIL